MKQLALKLQEEKQATALQEESSKVSRMRNMRKVEPGNSLMSQTEESIELPIPHSRI